MDYSTNTFKLYLLGRGSTLFAVISAIMLLAAITAIVCAAVAFTIASPLSINAMVLKELNIKRRLKIVQGADPQKVLNEYLAAKGRLTHVDDAASFPPHPSINNLMSLANEGNPWSVPSEIAERRDDFNDSLHTPQHQSSRVTIAPLKVINEYLNAVIGKKVKDRVLQVRNRVSSNDKVLFDSIFSESDIFHDFGHCSEPTPAVPGQTCAQTCFSSNAIKIITPFIAGGAWVSPQPGSDEPTEYCWTGNSTSILHKKAAAEISPESRQHCSTATALLVLTDDGGWQCRPQYPTYFGGRDGTMRTGCAFNPSVHKGPETVYNSGVNYVDVTSKRRIINHGDFAKAATFLRLIRASKTIKSYKRKAADPELLFKYPVVCSCRHERDVLDNQLLGEDVTRHMKFRGLYDCLENPCFMVPEMSDDFTKFDSIRGTCVRTHQSPAKTVNAILGDERTPLAGVVPAMGLVLADLNKRPDAVLTQRADIKYDEATAKKITIAASPVVTAKNLDSSNKTRNVLFVPVPSMVLPQMAKLNLDSFIIRPSSLAHMDCLPPLLIKPSESQARPFCTAPFYVEPAANVLAGHVPQKPYEHNMLVTECLRNSRMISGNVHGGAEFLYSTLLAQDSISRAAAPPEARTVGDERIDDIRDFFNRNFNHSRRLSTFEYLVRKENEGLERVFDGISRWDREFRRGDYEKTGINNVRETFVLREGLLMRSYGPYAATVLTPDSFSFDYMRGKPSAKTPSALKPFNPLQMAFPTSYSVLPEDKSPNDIFSTDSRNLFNSKVINRYFNVERALNATTSEETKLFSDDGNSSMSHYRVDHNDDAWGLQTFRLDYNPRNGPVITSDPRLAFDIAGINVTPAGATLTPLSLFKKTPLEWGHKEADMQESNWFRKEIDTSTSYRRLLAETCMVLRNMWFSLTWENPNYYYVKNS